MSNATILEQMDNEEAAFFVGNAIFIILLIIIGFGGNLVILIIYSFRMKSLNNRTFILFLGAMDMCLTTLGMPFFVVRYLRPFTHATAVFCKLFYFLNYFLTLASSQVLLVIAVERYRKVCLPFRRQISRKSTKILCVAVLCLALIIAWPSAAFAGITSKDFGDIGITINFCAIEEKYETFWFYFRCFLVIYVIAFVIVLAVLYTLIWRAAKKSVEFSDSTGQPTSTFEMSKSNFKLERIHNNQNLRNRKRMAIMFFLITVIFVVSYIPYTVIGVCISAGVFRNLSVVEITVLHFLQNIVYISNVTNCFVYSCFDVRFRCQIKALLEFCKKLPFIENQR